LSRHSPCARSDWDFPADIDAVGEGTRTAGTGEGFRQDADRKAAALIPAEHEDREMIGVPDRGRLVRETLVADSILPIVAQAALLTDWMAPTVATETGAGRVQFTIVPSGRSS